MKKIGIFAVLCGLAVGVQPVLADPINVSFASIGGADIVFKNGTFAFQNSTNKKNGTYGYDFSINGNSSTLSGDSEGDLGYLTGTFNIGAITLGATQDTAKVTGNGTLNISDGTDLFSANLAWKEIIDDSSGDGGLLAVVNLTGISYSGSSADLRALQNSVDQKAVLSFSFTPAETLTQLKAATGKGITNTFSGQISALPEPGFYGVLCVALMSLAGAGKVVAAKARQSRKS
jgi:hypothetical protein